MSKRNILALKLESDRMIYLDLLRIASSYMIIIYHFQYQMNFGQATKAVQASLHGFTLAVDMFFLISGFVISSVYSDRISSLHEFGKYMGKRAARLLPLHWLMFAIFAGAGILNATGYLHSNHPEIYDWRCAVPNLLLLHAFGPCASLSFNHVSWSISAEMGMYLLFPLLSLIAGRGYLSLLTVAAMLLLLTLVSRATGSAWLEWSFDFGVLRALPSFLLGMISYHHRDMLARVPWAARWLLVACLVFIAGSLLQWPKLLLLLLVYCVVALGIAASQQPSSRAARRFAPLSQLTYSLYMLHPLVQAVLLTGLGATTLGLRGVPMNLFVIGTMVLMLPIAWLSLVLFERPARHWMTRWMNVRTVPAENPMFTSDSRW